MKQSQHSQNRDFSESFSSCLNLHVSNVANFQVWILKGQCHCLSVNEKRTLKRIFWNVHRHRIYELWTIWTHIFVWHVIICLAHAWWHFPFRKMLVKNNTSSHLPLFQSHLWCSCDFLQVPDESPSATIEPGNRETRPYSSSTTWVLLFLGRNCLG